MPEHHTEYFVIGSFCHTVLAKNRVPEHRVALTPEQFR